MRSFVRSFFYSLVPSFVRMFLQPSSYTRVVKGGGGLDHVSWKIKRAFHNSRKIKQTFHTSRKKGERVSLNKSYIPLRFEKLRPKQSLVSRFHYPSTLGWFTLATESEAESESEVQGALRSSINQKVESEAESEARRNRSQKDQKSFFFF